MSNYCIEVLDNAHSGGHWFLRAASLLRKSRTSDMSSSSRFSNVALFRSIEGSKENNKSVILQQIQIR